MQVSPLSRTPDKNMSPRNSNRRKPSSASGLKPMKALMRKSSLKAVRPSMKKSYGIALYPKLDESRATCSSTLKDSKFPMYLDLHPGGTESEGTSVMKVCPYTYCSLNGHCHVPSPPLKRFLSARRRLLKTQKSMKLKGLSGDRIKEIDTGPVVFDGDPVILESDSAGSALSPLEEVYTDFFVEIFAKPSGEIAESENYGDAKRICNGDDDPKLDFSETPEVLKEASSDGDAEMPPPDSSESTETDIEDDDGDAESQFNELSSRTSDENNIEQSSALSAAEMDFSMTFHEDAEFDHAEVQDTENLACWVPEVEIGSECFIESNASKETEIIQGGTDDDASVSEEMDMEWEGEVAPYFDNGTDCSMFSDDGSVSISAHLPGNEDQHEGVCDSDDSVRTYKEETEETIILQDACVEDTESVTTLFGGAAYGCNNERLDDRDKSLEINKASDASQESTVLHEEESDCDILNSNIYNTNFTANAEKALRNSTEVDQNTNPEHDYDFFYEHAPSEDDTEEYLCTTGLGPLESDTETDQSAATGDHSSSHQHPDTDSESPQPNELDDDDALKAQTSEAAKTEMGQLVIAFDHSQEQVLQSADVGDAAERKEDNSNGLLKIQNSDLSETGQDIASDNHTVESITMETEVCQRNRSTSQENKSSQEVIDLNSITPDQSTPPATQCTFDDQPGMHDMDKNRDSEMDQGKLEYHCISKFTSFEECNDAERYGTTSAEDCLVTDNKMQLEDKPMMVTEEPCVASDNIQIQIPEKTETTAAGNNATEPLLDSCSNLKGKLRKAGKRSIDNCEQLKDFNPRAPRFLDPETDPEAEKVDLRHQMMDERKNAEEWMIDYALQQAVTKLAPARKRRVALLVEAFETVIPLPKYEAHLRHSAPSFTPSRPMQACS